MDKIFRPADILVPANCDMSKWSVIACDQFSSDKVVDFPMRNDDNSLFKDNHKAFGNKYFGS